MGKAYGLLPYLSRSQVKKMTTGIPVPDESLYDLPEGTTLASFDLTADVQNETVKEEQRRDSVPLDDEEDEEESPKSEEEEEEEEEEVKKPKKRATSKGKVKARTNSKSKVKAKGLDDMTASGIIIF